MGFLGFWGRVLRVILRWRRGANGRFCRGIPGFLGGERVRRGDSAHGGHGRRDWAKKFLKTFKKGVENREIGVREGSDGGLGAPYIGRGAIFGSGSHASSSVAKGALRAGASLSYRHLPEISEIHSPYI